MSVQISASLDLSIGHLGLAVSGFYGATATTTAVLGRWVSRYGPRIGLAVVMTVTGTVLAVLALSQSMWSVVAALLIGGVANGASHPASNAVLASGVRGHLGLALGIKQSSMPGAALAGGLAVPLIALTVGWRWAFALAAVVSFGLVIASVNYRPVPSSGEPGGARDYRLRPIAAGVLRLRLLSAGVLCGAAAGTSLSVFLVDGVVTSNVLDPAAAGLLAAGCGAVAVLVRISLGLLADRKPRRDPLVDTLILLAACVAGGAAMTFGPPQAFVAGAVLAAGFGFGWTGLVHLSAMRAFADDPARTTGVLMTGFAGGSCLGPLVLGQVASEWGYRPVWAGITALAALSAAVLAYVARHHRRGCCYRSAAQRFPEVQTRGPST